MVAFFFDLDLEKCWVMTSTTENLGHIV